MKKQDLKLGEIYLTDRGIVQIAEIYPDNKERSLIERIRSDCFVARAVPLFHESEVAYNLFLSRFKRKATDKDMEQALLNLMNNVQITDSLSVYYDEDHIAISSDYDSIVISHEDLQPLLKELNPST